MTGPCSRCGQDPGFDWAICPGCGASAERVGPGAAPASQDRWAPTIIEGVSAAGAAGAGWGSDFYRPVEPGGPRPRFGGAGRGGAGDATVHAGSPEAGRWGDESDETIIDRGPIIGESSDETMIVKNGRRGVSGPLLYLVERGGIRSGRVHLVTPDTSIGRTSDQDVVIADDTVSKRHAKIRLEEGRYMLWDLASANHSYVQGADGKRSRVLEPRELRDGDDIFLGEARLTYLEVDRDEE